MKWVDQFCKEAKDKGINCEVINRVNGWTETIITYGKRCFTKSITFNPSQELYFSGVDTKKLNEKGDFVLLCCGLGNKLCDIFLIPWEEFFQTLNEGEPVNTYKLPKVYLQYKFKIKNNGKKWLMIVQGGRNPRVDISAWRFEIDEAFKYLKLS